MQFSLDQWQAKARLVADMRGDRENWPARCQAVSDYIIDNLGPLFEKVRMVEGGMNESDYAKFQVLTDLFNIMLRPDI